MCAAVVCASSRCSVFAVGPAGIIEPTKVVRIALENAGPMPRIRAASHAHAMAHVMQRARGMSPHPVQFHVEPARMGRVQVVIRLAFLAAVAAIGCSSFYWLLYLLLPVLAALLISRDGAERYLREDAPGAIRILRWLAGAYAFLWLLTDTVPGSEGSASVELTVRPEGKPTPGFALLRIFTSLPALLGLAILSMAAALLWIIGAIWIVVAGRVPAPIADFIAMKLRYQFRLVAYHLSLVDAYPGIDAASLPHAPHPGAA